MTLAKFGVPYKKWSNPELHRFAQQRGMDLPGDDRKLWIRMLRKKDQEASLAFLDFPSEIRNMVYGLLLAPTRTNNAYRPVCYPGILRSCKQVNSEAADMLGMLFQDEPIPLEIDVGLHNDGSKSPLVYSAVVRLNDQALAQGAEGAQTLQVPWPRCIARFREIKMRVYLSHLQKGSKPPLQEDLRLKVSAAGHAQVNFVLYDLHRRLQEEKNLQQLDATVFTDLKTTYEYERDLLSPISALMGLAQTDSITFATFGFSIDIEFMRIAARFRTIRQLEKEAVLERELRKKLMSQIEPPSSEPEGPYRDALELCSLIGAVHKHGSFYTLAHPDIMLKDIRFVEGLLDEIEIEGFEERLPDMKDKVDQLRDMRAARKADAGTYASELLT